MTPQIDEHDDAPPDNAQNMGGGKFLRSCEAIVSWVALYVILAFLHHFSG